MGKAIQENRKAFKGEIMNLEKNKKVNVMFLNPAPSLIKYGMHWGMNKIGCNSYLFDYGETALFDKPQDYQLRKIEEMIKIQKTNLIFCEGYTGMPLKSISELCKKYNIQLHFWDIETPVTTYIAEGMLPFSDFMWSTCIEYVNKYKNRGYNSDLLLFGCNNDFHKPTQAEDRFKHDISVVGCNYDNRYNKINKFVLPLYRDNYDVMTYGHWWLDKNRDVNLCKYPEKCYKDGYLHYDLLGNVIASSKIMVGLNCSDESETQTSCRPYETLVWSNNAVYLAWYTKAQDKIFGDYIYQAKNRKEMLDMANEILSMTDGQRRQIAVRASDYVHNNHNYAIRAQTVIDKFFELGGL